MSTRVQFRRGNTAQTAAFTGAVAEVTINTDNNTLVVHDGTTAGGWQTPTLLFTQSAFNAANAAGNSAYVQASFDKANSANVIAQSGYNFANTVNAYAFSAYSTANSAQANTVITQGVDSTQNTWISSNAAFTQSAYTFANTVNVYSYSAYNFANTVNAYAFSAYSTANSAQSNTVISQGVDATQNTWISSNAIFTQSAYNFANSVNTYAFSAYSTANSAQANTVTTQGVDATQNTWISSNAIFTQSAYNFANAVNTYAFSAYSTANSAQANTVITQGVDVTQNTWISSNAAFTQSAYTFANTVNSYAFSSNTFLQANDATTLNSAKSYTDSANNALKSYSDGTFFTKSGGTISGSVTIQQNLTVNGNVSYTGNVTSIQVTGNTGQFFGYAANGFNALYAGIPTGYLIEPQMITQFTANYNGYAGINHQNINSGANSSSDIFITADNGTTNDGYVDIGMGSSTYNYPGYDVIKPNDGYFLVYGNTTTGGGNLILMTGLTNDIIFAANGTSDSNVIMRVSGYGNNVVIKSTVNSISNTTGALTIAGGLGVAGNVYAGNLYSFGTNIVPYIGSAYNKANGAVQTAFTTIVANGITFTSSSNTGTFTITANVSNGINIINPPASNTIDFGLATTGVTAGGYGNTTSIPTVTVDSFGRITSISNNSITVPPGTTIIANSGQITANASTGNVAIGLANTGVTAGVYGNTSIIPVITVDSYGRITSVSNTALTGGGGGNVTSSGYLNNAVIFANTTGYLSNTSNLNFFSSNNSLAVKGSIQIANNQPVYFTDIYDLDDISYVTDGFTTVFPLTYNQSTVSIPSPFNILVTINGLIQPAFDYKYDTVWLSNILTASKGYCIDISGNPASNGYIKFADAPPIGSQILMRTVAGSVPAIPKTYPFKPLDVLMGY